jgi:hypothetical protein
MAVKERVNEGRAASEPRISLSICLAHKPDRSLIDMIDGAK